MRLPRVRRRAVAPWFDGLTTEKRCVSLGFTPPAPP